MNRNRSKRAIRGFADLPQHHPGRFQLALRVGERANRREIAIWWQLGAQLRPCLAVTAMVHGDEFEGFSAAQQFWQKLRARSLNGSVLVIPTCNPWAAESATRCTPATIDGLNLARTFPGSVRGRPTERLAAQLWSLVSQADVIVDLHSGGMGYDFLPLAGYYSADDVELANCFPIKFACRLPANPGVLSYEMHRAGKRAIGCEWSGNGRLDPAGACGYLDGLMNVARRLGVTVASAHVTNRSLPRLHQTRFQLTRADGWFFPQIQLGSRIKHGQSVGTFLNIKLESRTIRSTCTGTIIALRTLPRVSRGDYLLVTAVPETRSPRKSKPRQTRSTRADARVRD